MDYQFVLFAVICFLVEFVGCVHCVLGEKVQIALEEV